MNHSYCPKFYSDVEYLRSMYPNSILSVYEKISDICDSLEYEGSLMFDEFPDKELLFYKIDEIMKNISPNEHHTYLKELVTILFLNEILHRRIRKGEF